MNKLESIYDIFCDLEEFSVVSSHIVRRGKYEEKLIGYVPRQNGTLDSKMYSHISILDSIGEGGNPSWYSNASDPYSNMSPVVKIYFYCVEIYLKRIKSYDEINSLVEIFPKVKEMIGRVKSLCNLELTFKGSLKSRNSILVEGDMLNPSDLTPIRWDGGENNIGYRTVVGSSIWSVCFC